MTLQQLRAFLAVVEEGSFRAAARRLGLSQAGLTTAVQALERTLGEALMVRSVRGVALTAAGQRLLPRAQLIDREARRAVDEAAEAGAVGGTLHVGVGPTPTALLLPRVVPDFHARHPQVRLKLMSGLHGRLGPALQQGLLDMALVTLPEGAAWPGTRRTLLLRSRLVVVGRLSHPISGGGSLADLADSEWILMGEPGGPGGTVMRMFAEHGLPAPRVAATCESFTEVAALVASTDWLALLPQEIVSHGLLGPNVAAVPIRETPYRYDTHLVMRADPPPTPAAAIFAAMCRSWARMAAAAERGDPPRTAGSGRPDRPPT